MNGLPRTVLMLGLVSLLTDLSSEMIYPLLPVFLAATLGATALQVGLIEGVAEATASLLKVVSGFWTDRLPRRKPLIVVGYSLSSLFRPLIGLAAAWPAVLALRFLDRVGKGLRTSPRDALIAETATNDVRGAAYGLHRAMDHAGAVGGPLIASALLTIPGVGLREVFLGAGIPAALAMATLLFGVGEPRRAAGPARNAPKQDGFHPRRDWRALGPDFHRLLLAVTVFTLGNATDAFLLIRLADAGVPAAWIAGLWSLHNAVKMTATWYGGRLSDRIGRRRAMGAGWALFGAVALAFATFSSPAALIAAFLVYGLHFGLVEPSERAWVADLAPPALRGTAFGLFHLAVGVAALPASLLFGALWTRFGPRAPFLASAAMALGAAALMRRVRAPG